MKGEVFIKRVAGLSALEFGPVVDLNFSVKGTWVGGSYTLECSYQDVFHYAGTTKARPKFSTCRYRRLLASAFLSKRGV